MVKRERLPRAARCVGWFPSGALLAAGLEDGSFSLHAHSADCGSKLPLVEHVCSVGRHAEAVTQIKASPDGTTLAVASADNTIDLWKVAATGQGAGTRCKISRAHRLRGHSSFVTQMDWSRCGERLQSVCGAHELLYWNASTGEQIVGARGFEDVARWGPSRWQTYTATLGFPVMGVWAPGSDGTDVNALHVSECGGFCVTSDDSGRVNLLHMPCIVDHAPASSSLGHSSHVANIRYLLGGGRVVGGRVVSIGGMDRSVIQWRILGDPARAAAANRAALQEARLVPPTSFSD
jgi:WD40 repeat protein